MKREGEREEKKERRCWYVGGMDQRQRERGNKMNAARRLSPDNFMTDSNTVQTAAMEREGEEGREEKDTVIKSWDMNRERGGGRERQEGHCQKWDSQAMVRSHWILQY
jgi:hypothetical protein